VRVQSLCPGFTYTEFHDLSMYERYDIKAKIPKALWMSADEVVKQSLRALERGRVICIPDFKNRVLILLAGMGLAPLLARMLESRLHM